MANWQGLGLVFVRKHLNSHFKGGFRTLHLHLVNW
jgi:hypothetical protein